MTQQRNPVYTGLESTLGEHARQLRELARAPGTWIYVGTYPGDAGTTPESPPFENGWANVGGAYPRASFYVDKWRRVHIRGAVASGDVGTVIFTLPVAYRPEKSERFVCAGAAATPVTVQVDPSGAVTQI